MLIMGSQRREFAPEHKDEAVKPVINTGRPVSVVGLEHFPVHRHAVTVKAPGRMRDLASRSTQGSLNLGTANDGGARRL